MGEQHNSTKNTIFGILSKKLSYKIRSKITAVAAILPIVMIFLTVLYSYSSIQTEREYANSVLTEVRNSEIDLITYAIIENNDKAKLQTESIKNSITNDLNDAYGNNIEEMKRDFESLNTQNKFYKILAKNIDGKYINKDNDNNRVFIATKDGVLLDDRMNYVHNSFRSWDEIINDTPNISMTKDSLEAINRNKTKEIILWIDNTSVNMNNINYVGETIYMPDNSGRQFIHDCIINGNLEELLQYNVIVCSYIYNDGDLFGIPNVETGVINDNDPLYVIQTYNIRDMIESNTYLSKTMSKYEYIINNNFTNYENVIHYKMIAMVIFCLLEAIAFFCVWYLAEFFIYFHNNKDLNTSIQRRKRKED